MTQPRLLPAGCGCLATAMENAAGFGGQHFSQTLLHTAFLQLEYQLGPNRSSSRTVK